MRWRAGGRAAHLFVLIVLALAKPSVKYEELANIVAVLDARRSRHQTDRAPQIHLLRCCWHQHHDLPPFLASRISCLAQISTCLHNLLGLLRPVEKISSQEVSEQTDPASCRPERAMLALRVLMLGSALIVLPLSAAAFSPLAVASQPAARRPLAASRHASQGAGTAFVPLSFSPCPRPRPAQRCRGARAGHQASGSPILPPCNAG